MNTQDKWTRVTILILFAGLSGCATNDFLPKSQWARFDGDNAEVIDDENYFAQYRVISLDGLDLDNRQSARVENDKVSCLRRDCKLYPGVHTIEVAYRWSTVDDEKKRRRKNTFSNLGHATLTLFGVLTGAGVPNAPSSAHNRVFSCYGTLTFKAEARRQYVLKFTDADGQAPAEEVHIIDVDSGVIAATSSPLCQ